MMREEVKELMEYAWENRANMEYENKITFKHKGLQLEIVNTSNRSWFGDARKLLRDIYTSVEEGDLQGNVDQDFKEIEYSIFS